MTVVKIKGPWPCILHKPVDREILAARRVEIDSATTHAYLVTAASSRT